MNPTKPTQFEVIYNKLYSNVSSQFHLHLYFSHSLAICMYLCKNFL